VKVYFIIVAGGSGLRLGGETPKQFLPVQGRMMIEYSLETILSWSGTNGLVLVSHPDYIPLCENLLPPPHPARMHAVTAGGPTRHASTLSGLAKLQGQADRDDLVFVHDAARPFVSIQELDRLLAVFGRPEALLASLAAPVIDTLFTATGLPGRVLESVDRSRIFAIKTPQVLRYRCLDFLELSDAKDYTDLLTWGQSAGIAGELVAAGPANRKITATEDLEWMESHLDRLKKP